MPWDALSVICPRWKLTVLGALLVDEERRGEARQLGGVVEAAGGLAGLGDERGGCKKK